MSDWDQNLLLLNSISTPVNFYQMQQNPLKSVKSGGQLHNPEEISLQKFQTSAKLLNFHPQGSIRRSHC